MSKLIFRIGLLLAVGMQLASSAGAAPRGKTKEKKSDSEIVVVVRERAKGPEYEIGTDRFAKSEDVKYYLGELRPRRDPNTTLVFLIEENVPLFEIRVAAAMSMAVGFKNVRAYVFWPFTGKMAEIRFGEVVKFSRSAPNGEDGDFEIK
jgi:hypothetical protein